MSDELTTIEGIGAKTADLMRAVGIGDTAALAVAEPDALATDLRAEGQAVSDERVQRWINAASAQAASGGTDGWDSWAVFMVVFEERGGRLQTTARHVDEDRDRHWGGHVPVKVSRWMEGQLDDLRRRADRPLVSALRDGRLVSAIEVVGPSGPLPLDADGNVTHPVSAWDPFAVIVTPMKKVGGAELAIRVRLIGGPALAVWDWPCEPDADGGLQARIPGLGSGLYRTSITSVELGVQESGPLLVVE